MLDSNRFATFKTLPAFNENDEFVGCVKVDNSNGFYDFIDSIIVIDLDDFIDNYTPAD